MFVGVGLGVMVGVNVPVGETVHGAVGSGVRVNKDVGVAGGRLAFFSQIPILGRPDCFVIVG